MAAHGIEIWTLLPDYRGLERALVQGSELWSDPGLFGGPARLPAARSISERTITSADDFSYVDPVDGSKAMGQGIRVFCDDGSRIVYRLSGTGTAGATLRVYVERFEPDPEKHNVDPQEALGGPIATARELAEIEHRKGRLEPSVVT